MTDDMRNIPQKIKQIENQMDRISRRQIRNMLDMSEIAEDQYWIKKPRLFNEYTELEEDNKRLAIKYKRLLDDRTQLRKKV